MVVKVGMTVLVATGTRLKAEETAKVLSIDGETVNVRWTGRGDVATVERGSVREVESGGKRERR